MKPLSRTMIATLQTLVVPNSLYLTKTDLGNFVILFLFRLQKLSFSHKSVSISFCSLYLFQNYFFTTLVLTRLPFGFNTIQYSWLHVTQSQLLIMNKIISTKDCLFMSVSGPPGSGKTDLFFQMLLKSTFYPSCNKIFHFYPINPNTVPLFLTTILILNL